MDFEQTPSATDGAGLGTSFIGKPHRVSRQQLDELVEKAYPQFNLPVILPPINMAKEGARFDVDLYRIVTSVAAGSKTEEPIKISGLLAVPVGLSGELPVVSWQHGTILSFDQVPSNLTRLADPDYPDYKLTDQADSLETLFNVHRFAGQGYAVIAADYVGKGPFRDGRGEAYVVKDISLRTCKAILEAGQAALRGLGLGPSKLFLNGWSQGSLNTLWLHQALRTESCAITATAVASPFSDLSETWRYWTGKQKFPLPHGMTTYPPLPKWLSLCMIIVLGSYEHQDDALTGLMESALRPEYRDLARRFWQDYTVTVLPGHLLPDSTDLLATGFFDYFTDERNSTFLRELASSCASYWKYDAPIRFYFGLADEAIHPAMVSRALSAGGELAVGVPVANASHRATFLAGLYGGTTTIDDIETSTLDGFENILAWFNTLL